MPLNNQPQLSAYWQRLMDEAEVMLKSRIDMLESETVDPEFCLLESDKRAMQRRIDDISGCQSVLETIEKREWGSKFWAFDTVMREKPGLALGLST